MSNNNSELERELSELPEIISEALTKWRVASVERERIEAKLHMRFTVDNPDKKAGDIKAYVNSSDERYNAVLDEAKAEAQYQFLYEKLLAAKTLAKLRTAY